MAAAPPAITRIALDGFSRSLLGVIAAGFMAWAGVVWDARNLVVEVQADTVAIRGELTTLTVELRHLRRELTALDVAMSKHEDARWHGEAGTAIATLRTRTTRLEHRLEQLEGARQ